MSIKIGPIDPLGPYGRTQSDGTGTGGLPAGILICDIIGVESPPGCRTVGKATEALKK